MTRKRKFEFMMRRLKKVIKSGLPT